MRLIWILALSLTWFTSCGERIDYIDESRQATGIKIGEVTSNSAIIWTRVTESASRRADGVVFRGRPEQPESGETIAVPAPHELNGSVPGAAGRVRLSIDDNVNFFEPEISEWVEVGPENDFTKLFHVQDLSPSTVYYFEIITSNLAGTTIHQPVNGRFETAPPADEFKEVKFTVVTGQANRDHDTQEGFKIYNSMIKLAPNFIVPTGDTVYYDSDSPRATSIELARYHWHRMYSFLTLRLFHLSVSGYWMKDDHDSYHNDNWPGMSRESMGTFSWEQGLQVYSEQVPMSNLPYRTFRWGKGLQIWLVEGRDFRSPNTMEDGPDKTIWGDVQKNWLKESLRASNANWKVLLSPTPVIGPDRSNKADNHANSAFRTEGDEMRAWFGENVPDNFFIVCGDRHWQYHSVHPQRKVHEFSSGPATDEHAGGSPGEDEEYHLFHREAGGFLSVTVDSVVDQSRITFRHHNVDGGEEYSWSRTKTNETN